MGIRRRRQEILLFVSGTLRRRWKWGGAIRIFSVIFPHFHTSSCFDKILSDSILSLPLAPLLATAQVKPGETQEEEANSGEVWKHWNENWVSAGYFVLLDFWDFWLTRLSTWSDHCGSLLQKYTRGHKVTEWGIHLKMRREALLYLRQNYKPL